MTATLFACYLSWCITPLTPVLTPDQCIVIYAKAKSLAPAKELQCKTVD